MNKNWSAQLEAAYALRLPADLRSWLDDEIWRRPSDTLFSRPLTPGQLLEPEQGAIWAGFMLPDTLPIIGSTAGDWLCLRFNAASEVAEVVCWCHGGGDYIPYGRSLAEALLYDAVFQLIYHPLPEHHDNPPQVRDGTAGRWAWQFAGFRQPGSYDELMTGGRGDRAVYLRPLIEAGIAEVAARRDMILYHLECQLKLQGQPAVAARIGAAWEPDFVSWLFDTALIPELTRDQLCRYFELPSERLLVQDWHAAEGEALAVTALRSDLEWPFAIAGWAAERRNDPTAAIQLYLRGVYASCFSDHSITFRTHWFPEGLGKFSAARLLELRGQLPLARRDEAYLQIFWENDAESLRTRIRDYWFAEANEAARQQRWLDAYRCFYAAGWDCGLNSIGAYGEILERLRWAAENAGATALAAVARLHASYLPGA